MILSGWTWKKVLEDWKMIPRTKNNEIVTFVNKDLLNPVKEAGTQTNCCTNTHTHTLYWQAGWVCCVWLRCCWEPARYHLPPDGEKSEALCHIHLSSTVRVCVRKMDKQAAGLDNTVMNTHRLCWGSVFKCAPTVSSQHSSNNNHFTCRIHKAHGWNWQIHFFSPFFSEITVFI